MQRVKRVILCSGKHFYALDAYRREKGLKNTALIRLEVTGMKTASAEYVTFFLLSSLFFSASLSLPQWLFAPRAKEILCSHRYVIRFFSVTMSLFCCW